MSTLSPPNSPIQSTLHRAQPLSSHSTPTPPPPSTTTTTTTHSASPLPHTPASSDTSDEFKTPESVFGHGAASVWSGGDHSKESSSTTTTSSGDPSSLKSLDLNPTLASFHPSSSSANINLGSLLGQGGWSPPHTFEFNASSVDTAPPPQPPQQQQRLAEDVMKLNISSFGLQDPISLSSRNSSLSYQHQQEQQSAGLGVEFVGRQRSASNDDWRRQEINAQLGSGGGQPKQQQQQQIRAYSPFEASYRASPPPPFHNQPPPPPPASSSSPSLRQSSPSHPFRVTQPSPSNSNSSRPSTSSSTPPNSNGTGGRVSGLAASIHAPKPPYTSNFVSSPSSIDVTTNSVFAGAAAGGGTDKINVVVSPKRDAWEIAAEQSRWRASLSAINYGLGIDMGLGMGVMPEKRTLEREQQSSFGRGAAGGGGGGLDHQQYSNFAAGPSPTPTPSYARERSASTPDGRSSGSGRGPLDVVRAPPARYSVSGQGGAAGGGGGSSSSFSPSSSLAPSPGPGYVPSSSQQQPRPQHQQLFTTFARSDSSNSLYSARSPRFPSSSNELSSPVSPTNTNTNTANGVSPGGFQNPYMSALLSALAQQNQHQLSQLQPPLIPLPPPTPRSLLDQRTTPTNSPTPQKETDQELLTRFQAIQYLHPGVFGRHASSSLGGGAGAGADELENALLAGVGFGGAGGFGAGGGEGGGGALAVREVMSLSGLGPGVNPVVMDPGLQKVSLSS